MSGIQLKSDRRDLNVGFSGELAFHSDEDIQTAVASLAQAIFKNDVSTSSEVGGVGFAFGSDSKNENIVDTFSKVSISVLVQRFIPEIHKIYQSSLTSLTDVESFLQMSSNSTISFPIVMKRAVVDVPEKNTLSIDTLADVSSLPFKAAIDIPHLSLSIRSNKDEIIRTNILNTKVSSDGQVSTLVNIKFQENDAAFQNLFEVANRIQAHKVEANDDLITTHSIAFGSSEKKILTFQKVEFPLRIKPIVDKLIQKQPDPNANIVHNWWSVFTEQGIVTLFELWEDNGLADFSWLKIKAKITAKTAVQKDREGEVVFVANIAVLDINIPKINAVLAPIIENDSTARGLFLGTEKFLGFKDFGSDGRNGYAVLTGTTGAKLTAFQNCWVWAGEVVLFHPMTLNLVPSWIWDPRDPLQLRAPLMTLLSFKNGGPLHMDIGKMTLTAFKNGRKMFALESKGDWVIRNWLEGAGDFQKPLNQGKFFFEFSIRLVTPFALIDLIDGLIHRNEMQFSLILKRGDQEISWAPKVFDALYKMGGLAALGPMIGKILKNINFRVFGIGKRRRESTITIGDTVKRSDVNASATSDLWDDDLQHPTNLTVIMDPFENLEPVVMVDTPNIIIVAR